MTVATVAFKVRPPSLAEVYISEWLQANLFLLHPTYSYLIIILHPTIMAIILPNNTSIDVQTEFAVDMTCQNVCPLTSHVLSLSYS
jgi:hypothetical protein